MFANQKKEERIDSESLKLEVCDHGMKESDAFENILFNVLIQCIQPKFNPFDGSHFVSLLLLIWSFLVWYEHD